MIPAETRARIRRLFFAEHWKIGTIAAELDVHHDAVRHAIEVDRFSPVGAPLRASRLDAYKGFLRDTLDQHPRLRATRLFEMVRGRGYLGGVVQLRRYVATVRPRGPREAFFRLETLAGEQGQVDWASFGTIRIGRAVRKLSCFVMVLSWSRAIFARFALDQTLESFVRGHVAAFDAFDGVPRRLLYDNLKSVVLGREGQHIHFHPRLLELAGHYHFAPVPCAPYRGNEKGKVERAIHYLRYSFFEARAYSSLDDLNAQLRRWIDDIAMARRRGEKTVRDLSSEEMPRLLPLPEHPFELDLVRPIASGKTPYVRFDGNDYSIPHTLVRRPLTLAAGETTVRILQGAEVVARHARSYDKGARVEDNAHLDALGAEKQRASELRGRDRLRASCPAADAFLTALAARHERLSAQTARLLRLLDRYGAKDLDAALVDASRRGALSAEAVAHLLDQQTRRRGEKPPVPMPVMTDARAHELHVTPHALAPYDGLAAAPKVAP